MIDKEQNVSINNQLSKVYFDNKQQFLEEYKEDFKKKDSCPPGRINEFGIIDETKYDADNGILFILKETNGWANEHFDAGILFRGWVKDVSLTGLAGRGHIKRHPTMWYNLGRWIAAILDPEMPVSEIRGMKDEAIKALGSAAITNINKVRGYNNSRKEYSKVAKSDISGFVLRKELEILNPRIIVCCGTSQVVRCHAKDYIKEREKEDRFRIVDMPHPAAPIKALKMINDIRSSIDQLK